MCTTTLGRPSAASASAEKSSVYRRALTEVAFFQVDTATGCSRLLYGRLSNDPTSVPVTTSCRILLYVIHLSSSLCAYSCKRLFKSLLSKQPRQSNVRQVARVPERLRPLSSPTRALDCHCLSKLDAPSRSPGSNSGPMTAQGIPQQSPLQHRRVRLNIRHPSRDWPDGLRAIMIFA